MPSHESASLQHGTIWNIHNQVDGGGALIRDSIGKTVKGHSYDKTFLRMKEIVTEA